MDMPRIARSLAPHVQAAPDPDAWLKAFAAAVDELLPEAVDLANRRAGSPESRTISLSAARAPHGYTAQHPLMVQGKAYVGGQWIPGHVMDRATAQEKAAIQGGAPGQTGMAKQHEAAHAQQPTKQAPPKKTEKEPEKTGALYGHNSFPKAPEGDEKYGGKIEKMPGLSEDERKIEANAANMVLTDFPKLRAEYLKAGNGEFGPDGKLKSVVFNTDEWRDLFPGYRGTNAPAVHEPSSYANKQLLAEFLPIVPGKPDTAGLVSPLAGAGNRRLAIYAGGGGSGKGTAVKEYFDEAQYPLRVDQVTDKFKKASELFDRAKANGFEPEYIFVDRKPQDAWAGVVGRALHLRKIGKPARTVPIDIALKANIEARRTAIEILEKRPDVTPNIIDNVGGEGARRLITDRAEAIDYLKKRLAEDEQQAEAFRKQAKDDIVRRAKAGEIPLDVAQGLMGGAKKFEEHANGPVSGPAAVPQDHAAGAHPPAAKDDRRDQPGRHPPDTAGGPSAGRGPAGAPQGAGGQAQPLTETSYVDQAMANLKKTSRTAGGVVDTSASPEKAGKIAEGLTGEKAAEHANRNFEQTIKSLYLRRDQDLSPRDAGMLADKVNVAINTGITKPGTLMRTDDSPKYPYTKAAELPVAKRQFAEELSQRLNDPKADPVETAAWIEWRANLTDHFWADGCGKASKALAALPLMRAGLPLPHYPDNKEFFKHASRTTYDPKQGGQTYLDDNWKRFLAYYRTLMPKAESQSAA